MLWTSDQLARTTSGRASGAFAASGVSIDSRTLRPGDLFVALSGPNFDGHEFVDAALAKGAAGALVEHAPASDDHRPLVAVDDTQAALTALGAAGRSRSRARVVGITGSVGKTGTKTMTAEALSVFGSVHASEGNLNNRFGLPLTLARLRPDTDFAVVEMGMNRAGEISALTKIARPDVAVVTTVEAVHLKFFDGITQIAAAKAEIFEGVTEGGTAVVNRDNALFRQLASAARANGIENIVEFGALPGACVQLLDYSPHPGRNRLTVSVAGETLQFELGLDGRHWALDSLAVVGCAYALGLDAAAAARALKDARPAAGRGARYRLELPAGPVEMIDDSYNASPAATRAALDLLSNAVPAPGGRRVAALGDMLELGERAGALHRQLAPEVERADIDLVFTAGPHMAALHEALPSRRRGTHAEDADALVQPLAEALGPGDVVLVKGSRGSAMHRVADALRKLGCAKAIRPALSGDAGC